MLKIGLTGNIGSGKSVCSRIFALLGIPVYNADIEAKKLYYNDVIKAKVVNAFGDNIITSGEIDKIKLAQLVFNDKLALEILNNIIHPEVKNDFNNWINKQDTNLSYVIQEAAIIYESGFDIYFDKIIVVSSPIDLRIQRIMQRDKISEIEIRNRMNNQMSDEIKAQKADYIIHNSNNELLIPQIIEIDLAISNLKT